MPNRALTHRSARTRVQGTPTAADRLNAETFDAIVASLFSPAELRPRLWLMRLSLMLGRVGEVRSQGPDVTAQRMGVTPAVVRRLETGMLSRQGPSASLLLAYADAQDCDIEIIVRDKGGAVLGSVSSADLSRDARELAAQTHR